MPQKVTLNENVIRIILDCHGGIVDFMLLVDTTNYTPGTWNSTKTGLRWILEELNTVFGIVPTGTHVGLAIYNDEGYFLLGVRDGTDITKVKPWLNTIVPGDTEVHNLMAGLNVASAELLNNSRDHYKVVIAVVNSEVTNEADTASRAQYLSSKGVNIIVVSLLPNIQLGGIATHAGNVFQESYESLNGIWNNTDLASKMCPTGEHPSGTLLFSFIVFLIRR